MLDRDGTYRPFLQDIDQSLSGKRPRECEREKADPQQHGPPNKRSDYRFGQPFRPMIPRMPDPDWRFQRVLLRRHGIRQWEEFRA
jgi:hypothetical protein